jgi:hypothetical protein
MVEAQPIRRALEMSCELLDRVRTGIDRDPGAIVPLEFLQLPVLEMGHRTSL